MNALPSHRQIIAGRTWGRAWSPSDFDPISGPHSNSLPWSRIASVALAVAIGIGVAVSLVAWWSA